MTGNSTWDHIVIGGGQAASPRLTRCGEGERSFVLGLTRRPPTD